MNVIDEGTSNDISGYKLCVFVFDKHFFISYRIVASCDKTVQVVLRPKTMLLQTVLVAELVLKVLQVFMISDFTTQLEWTE